MKTPVARLSRDALEEHVRRLEARMRVNAERYTEAHTLVVDLDAWARFFSLAGAEYPAELQDRVRRFLEDAP